MDTSAKREYLVLGVLAVCLLLSIIPSLQFARREYRDGLVREGAAQVKRELEDIYNKKEQYPLAFPHSVYEYHVVNTEGNAALGWFVRARIENPHPNMSAFDAEEGHNFQYRYVNEGSMIYFDICGGEYNCL